MQHGLMRDYYLSIVVTIIGIILAGIWAGPLGVFTALILGVLEVSLSFDNAVLNAIKLRQMSPKWQHRFLTWGILIAVFGMRLVFPVLIVAVVAKIGMLEVLRIAISEPETYARILESSHAAIASFGGIFLLLVFLNYILDPEKATHWIGFLERRLCSIGKLDMIEVVIALLVLVVIQNLVPLEEHAVVLSAGIIGIVVFILLNSLSSLLEGGEAGAQTGFMAFLYLEVLDASFSFDGVIGAFAITNDILIIMIGLGIGAMFVRSMTVTLTRKGTLQKYIYLEHGAHYAIGVLAFIMLLGLRIEIPEVITGLIGGLLIAAALLSSVLRNRGSKTPPAHP